MALQAQQIINLAVNIAKTPGYLAIAGQFLNDILAELPTVNDFEQSRGLLQINTAAPAGHSIVTGQPYYSLAADHLHILKDGVFYLVTGVPYTLIETPLSKFDQLIETAGFSSLMVFYAVDDSQSPAQIYFWPPADGAYQVNIRYAKKFADITTPETSSTVPWFPYQHYLITELAARLMEISNDDRADAMRAKAASLLKKWLIMQRDSESYALRVELDRNRFGTNYSGLPNSKKVGF